MTTEQQRAIQAAEDLKNNNERLTGVEKNATEATNENIFIDKNEPVLKVDQSNEEVANNDGSIVETLDTAFHNKPGYIKDHSIAGSNRADYYEARSQGESDVEEEQDYLKKQE